MNRILTDVDRAYYQPIIDRMYKDVPEMSGNKIGTAIVQQAFVYDIARRYVISTYKDDNVEILSAGSYQDTAAELLRFDGFAVYDVDPVINTDLRTFKARHQATRNTGYEIIISTSVLEHTANDEEFIADICDLLVNDGRAVLTCDFKDDYTAGDPVPYTSNRFYTKNDLLVRLPNILTQHGCSLVEVPNYDDKDTFIWDGINYSFATFVFRKDKEHAA